MREGMVQQNDPREMLEVFDAAGRATGVAKTRAAIHLDGDWHLAFHCWILRKNGREIVLQRRSLQKDTFAGLWDATAAGHWRFGEVAAEAAREIEEELGITVPFESLRYRGRERASRQFPNGLTDREFHEVYTLQDDRSLGEYRPNSLEVSGLAAFPTSEVIALADGDVGDLEASEAVMVDASGNVFPCRVVLTRENAVPYSGARLRRTVGLD